MNVQAHATLSEAQEEVLVLVGHGEVLCIGRELEPALSELFEAGLVAYRDPVWSLTDAGKAAFDRLMVD